MACTNPLKGYKSKTVNPSGKRSIVFNINEGYKDKPVYVPCGQCISCRLKRSQQKAIQCVHEASLYEDNSFVTLTYSDENLPPEGSLQVEHFQKFMKKLRMEFRNTKIRYYHCGEYGEQFARPHYHALLFNLDFKDKKHEKTVNGEKYYSSESLNKLWKKGYAMIGNVTFESAAYVARYVTKKITGELAHTYYNEIDFETGEILRELKPEYATGSQGIGKEWFKKYKTDVFPHDFIVYKGGKLRVPKYYDNQLEIMCPSDYKRVKARRLEKAKESSSNTTWERLQAKDYIQKQKAEVLKRSYEK